MNIAISPPPPVELWTVYELYEPLVYVARLSVIDGHGAREGDRVMASSYLDTLRTALASRGLHWIAPDPNDDPMIVELWL